MKTEKMTIEVMRNEDGLPYMKIYEIVGINKDGGEYPIGFQHSLKVAEERAKWHEENLKDLYKMVLIFNRILWLDE